MIFYTNTLNLRQRTFNWRGRWLLLKKKTDVKQWEQCRKQLQNTTIIIMFQCTSRPSNSWNHSKNMLTFYWKRGCDIRLHIRCHKLYPPVLSQKSSQNFNTSSWTNLAIVINNSNQLFQESTSISATLDFSYQCFIDFRY